MPNNFIYYFQMLVFWYLKNKYIEELEEMCSKRKKVYFFNFIIFINFKKLISIIQFIMISQEKIPSILLFFC